MSVYVRALWDFAGKEPGDLSFEANEVITVTKRPDGGWWTGFVKDRGTAPGTFPSSYVELLHPEGDGRAAASSPTAPQPAVGEDLPAAALPARGRRRIVSLHSMERITSLQVESAERVLVGSELRSIYHVRVVTTKRGESVVDRRYNQVCELEAQLRKLFPAACVEQGANLRRAEVMSAKKTARVMELRRTSMEAYLQQLLTVSNASMLLLTWLFPGQQIGMTEEEQEASAPPTPVAEAAPVSPAAAASTSAAVPPSPRSTVARWKLRDGFTPGSSRPFSLPSLDAFDDMMDKGYAVFLADGRPLPADAGCAAAGQVASVQFISCIWDGAATATTEVAVVDECDMTVGRFDHVDVLPPGLHVAATRVPLNTPFVAVFASSLAFGNLGAPPTVPGFSQIVVEACIDKVSGTPAHGEVDLLPAALAAVAEVQAPRMGGAGAVVSEADASAALHGGAAGSRKSLAYQPARLSRVVVGAGSPASAVPAAMSSHVAGYRRSNSEPVDLEAAEAAMRALMASQTASDTAPKEKSRIKQMFGWRKNKDKGAVSAPSSPSATGGAATPPSVAPAAAPAPAAAVAALARRSGRSHTSPDISPHLPPSSPSSPASATSSPRGGPVVPPPVPRRHRSSGTSLRTRATPTTPATSPTASPTASGASSPMMMTPIVVSPPFGGGAGPAPGTAVAASPSLPSSSRAGGSVGGCQVLPLSTLVGMKEQHRYPDDVDSRRLEAYLSPEEFATAFGMDYAAFNRLPKWKRDNRRKELKLF